MPRAEPKARLISQLQDHIWAEIKNLMLNDLSHPGTPICPIFLLLLLLFFKYLFLREHKRERGRERGAGDLKWALCWQADSNDPGVGPKLTNREVMTWAEASHSTNWATHVPPCHIFKDGVFVFF